MKVTSFLNPMRSPIAALAIASGFGLSLLASTGFAQTAPGAGVFQDAVLGAPPTQAIAGAIAQGGSPTMAAGSGSKAVAGAVFESTRSLPLAPTLGRTTQSWAPSVQPRAWVPPSTGHNAAFPATGAASSGQMGGFQTQQAWAPGSINGHVAAPQIQTQAPVAMQQYAGGQMAYQSGEIINGGCAGCAGGGCGGGAIATDGVYVDQGFDMSEYAGYASYGSAPVQNFVANEVYQPAIAAGRQVNTLIGVSGLVFGINNGDRNRELSSNGTDKLFTDSVDQDLTGVEAVFARRKSYGDGWEIRYFNLDSGVNSASVLGAHTVYAGPGYVGNVVLPSIGLSGVGFGGVSAATVFNDANVHTLTRESNINNLEFNWLRRGNTQGRRSVENFVGFRYFQFDDRLSYSASDIRPSSVPGYVNPQFAQYHSDVENDLYGIQFGRRSTIPVFKRISLFLGLNGGVFNNRTTTDQHTEYILADGSFVTPPVIHGKYAGTLADFKAEENHISLLGEVDLGLIYQISNRMRARIGYRGIGVTDVAFAGDQLEDEIWNVKHVKDINTDANLILNGGYAGLEFAW